MGLSELWKLFEVRIKGIYRAKTRQLLQQQQSGKVNNRLQIVCYTPRFTTKNKLLPTSLHMKIQLFLTSEFILNRFEI